MPEPQTRAKILAAAKEALLEAGYASLSTRRIAESAGVPLSQIHYHFGSKQKLVLELLDEENRLLLLRQQHMYGQDVALWKRWEQACDFLEDDIESGYVRVLQEMTAAGWSDATIAARVRDDLRAWFELLAVVATDAEERLDGASPFTPRELAVLTSTAFLGVESMILLGFTEEEMPMRSALRSVGEMIRRLEDPDAR
jgi:AcrR family transcriptional regulator